MSRLSSLRRALVLPAAGALLGAVLVGPAAADVGGVVSGTADADLLQVEAVSLPAGCGDESLLILGLEVPCVFQLAEVVLGDSEAAVDSTGGLAYDGSTELTAFGHGSNLDVDLLNAGGTVGAISEDLLVRSDVLQPGSDTTSDADELLSLPENPLLELDVARTSATAFDVGSGNTSCPELVDGRATLASGRNELAGLAVAPDALGDGQDLVGATDPGDVSFAESRVELVDALVGGPADGTYGVESTATTLLAPVDLFGGMISLRVTQPELVASHDGQELTTSYTAPVVTINGDPVIDGETIDFLDMLDVPENPLLGLTVGIANEDDVVVDGDTASLTGVVTLELSVADTLGVVSLSLGDLSASATAPAGGATLTGCDPIAGAPQDALAEVAKDASSAQVAPGATFQYALVVPNRGGCTVTDVVVTDTISGPAGFEVVDTEPSGTVDGDTITWTVDELAPDEVRTFLLTVRVPDDATVGDEFDDLLRVTGDCDGVPEDVEVPLDGVPVVAEPTVPGCDVSGSNKASTHLEVVDGQSFSYLVHVVNGGADDCGAVEVTDPLPAGATFVSCAPQCTTSGDTVSWSLDGLASGASRTFSVTVTADGEDLANTATITVDGDDTDVSTGGPDVTDESVPAPGQPGAFPASRGPNLANTGGGAALLGALALGAAAVVARRRED